MDPWDYILKTTDRYGDDGYYPVFGVKLVNDDNRWEDVTETGRSFGSDLTSNWSADKVARYMTEL